MNILFYVLNVTLVSNLRNVRRLQLHSHMACQQFCLIVQMVTWEQYAAPNQRSCLQVTFKPGFFQASLVTAQHVFFFFSSSFDILLTRGGWFIEWSLKSGTAVLKMPALRFKKGQIMPCTVHIDLKNWQKTANNVPPKPLHCKQVKLTKTTC